MLLKLSINSSQKREVINITNILNDLLLRNGLLDGISTIFCLHTTCALATVDLDEGGTNEDYINAFEKMIPNIPYKHPHDPTHFGEHLLSSTIGSSLSVPVQSGNLVLGIHQKVAIVEFSGPRERHVVLSFLKSTQTSAL